MTTDVSAALATLQLHPEDSQALKALAALHPGNGAGIDADGAVEGAVRRAPLPPRTGRLRAGRLADRSRAGVDDRGAAPRRPAAREGARAVRRAAARRGGPGLRARGAGGRRPGTRPPPSRWRRCRWCAPTGSRSRSATCSRRRGPRIRRSRPACTAPSPSSTSSTGPADGEGETFLRRSLELDPAQPPLGQPLRARAAREGQQRGAADALRAARRSRRQPRRARAGRGRGRRAVRQDEPRRSTPTRTSARRWTRTRSSRARCAPCATC